MIMKKETLVFLTSLAIIFIIGYVNLTLMPKKGIDENELAIEETEVAGEEAVISEIDEAVKQFTDYEILGDITDITDIANLPEVAGTSGDTENTANSDPLNVSFANFKLNKERGNMEIVDQLEQNLSNSSISENTKKQFENMLLNKNEFIKTEQNLELMLQSKGYNQSVAVVDENMVKIITNDNIEQADATIILDIIMTETNFEPSQIKIVKFDNIDL